MKSFLCINKKPNIRWTNLPDNTYYEGPIPEGYTLAVSPSEGYIVVDVDRHGDKNGFDYIPKELEPELYNTLHYPTKNNGMHFWFKYTGNVKLLNKHSIYGIDLRIGQKGYVIWYSGDDFRKYIPKIKESSEDMNKWLQELFGVKTKKK